MKNRVFSQCARHSSSSLGEGSCSPLRSRLQGCTCIPKHAMYIYRYRTDIYTCIGTSMCLYTWQTEKKQPSECQFINSAKNSFGFLLSAGKTPLRVSENNRQKRIACHSSDMCNMKPSNSVGSSLNLERSPHSTLKQNSHNCRPLQDLKLLPPSQRDF